MKRMGLVLAVFLTLPLHSKAADKTFCQFWLPGSQQDKMKFLLDREPDVRGAIIKNNPGKEEEVDATMRCYVAKSDELVNILDKDCQVERALSDFFGQQTDTTDQEMSDITEFVNQCARQAFNKEGAK